MFTSFNVSYAYPMLGCQSVRPICSEPEEAQWANMVLSVALIFILYLVKSLETRSFWLELSSLPIRMVAFQLENLSYFLFMFQH